MLLDTGQGRHKLQLHQVFVLIEWCVLSGPAILRISVLLIIAGVLAAIVQVLLPNAARQPDAPADPAAPNPPVVRPAEPAAPSTPPAATGPARERPAPSRTIAVPTGPVQAPPDAPAVPPGPAAPDQAREQEAAGQAEVEQAEESAGPAALAVVDLNTASVADLNRLRGGGAIGRAIVAKRPYTSVDQLLAKRVLSRPVYERIKDQVTVR
jgi:hypothetical protein